MSCPADSEEVVLESDTTCDSRAMICKQCHRNFGFFFFLMKLMSEVSSHPKGLLPASHRILVRGHKEPRAPPEAKMHGQEISTRQVELD